MASRASSSSTGLSPPRPLCERAPGLQLAVFQGERHHTDLFGFLLDFAATCGHNLTLFVGHASDPVSAVPIWQRLYGPLELHHTSDFPAHHARFHAILFTTPDTGNPEVHRAWQLANQGRCIYLSHKSNQGFTKNWQVVRLYSSPLSGYPHVITAFGGESPLLAGARERVAVYVGSIYGENAQLDDIAVHARALAVAGFLLHIYCNTIEGNTAAFFAAAPNVKWFKSAPTTELYAAVARAAFFLILPAEDSVYLTDRGTNSLALAFSFGTPILTNVHFAGLYDLSRAGTGTLAPALMADVAAELAELTPLGYEGLVTAAVAHREVLLRHNVRAFEYALDALPALSSKQGLLPLPAGIKWRLPYDGRRRL